VSPDVVIRALTASDLEAVASLQVAAFADTAAGAVEQRKASLREDLARSWARVRVAERESAIVGASVSWIVADEVHVLDVATHPHVQRQGIGRELVRDIIALARSYRARHVYLEVRRSNGAALALYRSVGFASVGVRAKYYSDDEDAIEMALVMPALPSPP
jgi:ribosomal-protein-alanine N-acetyltransferase